MKKTRTYEKRSATTKDKEETTGRRADSWYNQIPYPPPGWATHKTGKELHCRGLPTGVSFEPHIRLPSPGVWQGEEKLQSTWLWRSVGLTCRSHTGLGEIEVSLWKGAHKISCIESQGKSSNLIGAWARPTCWFWSLLEHPGDTDTGGSHTEEHSVPWTLLLWQLTSWLISFKIWNHPQPTGCRGTP